MTLPTLRTALRLAGPAVTAGLVFMLDLSSEMGVAEGTLYVAVVAWLTFTARRPRWVWVGAAICSALTVIGYVAQAPGSEPWKMLANRSVGLLAIWVTALLCVHILQLLARQAERTDEIDRAVAHLELNRDELQRRARAMLSILEDLQLERRRLTYEVQERKRAEERFRLVVESMPSAIVMVDSAGVVALANPQAEKWFGYARAELLGLAVEALVPPRFRDRHPEYRQSFLAAPQARPMGGGRDLYGLRKDGSEFPVEIGLVPVETDRGLMVLAAIVDITERKQAEEQLLASLREKETLLKEVHHRVKNNLAVIDGLLGLQAGRARDPAAQAVLRDCRDRVHSMALIHETLYRASDLARIDFAAYVRSLCDHLFDSYRSDRGQIELSLDMADIRLDLDRAVPLGLLLNELLSNTLKHAFPSGQSGRVRVALRPGPDGAVALMVADTGVGLPGDLDVRRVRSLGLRLIDSLTRQLGGTIEFERDRGTTVTITFSASTPGGRDHAESKSEDPRRRG